MVLRGGVLNFNHVIVTLHFITGRLLGNVSVSLTDKNMI